MDLLSAKILVAILLGLVRFLFGILPVKVHRILLKWETKEDNGPFISERRHKLVNCALVLFQSFSGGVLFATCLLHMMPDVYYSVEEFKTYTESESAYPLSQLIVSLGFLMIYFIEEGSHWLITRIPKEPVKCHAASAKNRVTPEGEEEKSGTPYVIEYATELDELEDEDKGGELVLANNEKNLQTQTQKSEEETKQLEQIVEDDVITQQYIFRGILTILALALHSLLEGLSIGLQNSVSNVWYLATAVSVHSATILFCLGCELLLVHTRTKVICIHILVLAVTSPLGVVIGLLVTLNYAADSKAKSLAVVFLEGLSAGTILYITFFEVLNREKERRVYRMRRAACILGGFLLMAVLQTF